MSIARAGHGPRVGAAALLGVLFLTACGGDDPVPIAATFGGVEYYGACGNEIAEIGEIPYYPLLPDEVDDLDESKYPVLGGLGDDLAGGMVLGAFGGVAVSPSVAEPGPGDDVGTAIVYADGIARFESESGRVIWLTAEPRTYDFVC